MFIQRNYLFTTNVLQYLSRVYFPLFPNTHHSFHLSALDLSLHVFAFWCVFLLSFSLADGCRQTANRRFTLYVAENALKIPIFWYAHRVCR